MAGASQPRPQQEGKIRPIGLSGALNLQIASVQNRYSVGERQGDPMVVYSAREGVAFVPHGPLGVDPTMHGAPIASTKGALADIGKRLGATATQVASSWLLYRSKHPSDPRDNLDCSPGAKCGGG